MVYNLQIKHVQNCIVKKNTQTVIYNQIYKKRFVQVNLKAKNSISIKLMPITEMN